jgi:prevent-host-death family protein
VYTVSCMKRTQDDLTVGVRELRANLSRYLAEVAKGSAVVVTDHGTPIARLTAVDEITPGFRRMVEEGRIRLATKPATDPSTWERITPRGSVSDLVREQRR